MLGRKREANSTSKQPKYVHRHVVRTCAMQICGTNAKQDNDAMGGFIPSSTEKKTERDPMDSMDPERVTVEYSSKMNPSLLLASRHVVALSHVPNPPEPPNQAHLLRTDTICIMLSDLLYYFFLSYSIVILFYRSSRILIVSIYVCSRRYWGYRHRYTQ